MPNYNPRYVVYARAHGRTPEAMLEHDRTRFPGGHMCGFILWIRECWHSWAVVHKHPYANDSYAILSDADIRSFDVFLEEIALAQEINRELDEEG